MVLINKKNEIIQAARKIFAHYGYDKTTMEDIGKVVGLNKASLYYYYKNKESIFVDVLQSELDSFMSGTMNKLESVEGSGNKIAAYLMELLSYSRNNANLVGLANENMQSVRPYIRTLSEGFFKKHIHFIAETLEMGVKEGEFKECDTERVAISILKISDALTSPNHNCLEDENTNENPEDDTEGDMMLIISLVLDGLSKVQVGESGGGEMELENLYDAIFKRKSIRKYSLAQLEGKVLEEISAYMHTLKSLEPTIRTEFRILQQDSVKSLLPWKAPYYIAAFSEIKEGYLTNIGFMLQQVDLFLSSKGIGSCWQGWPKPMQELVKGTDLEFIIVLAFGKPNEPLHRVSLSEFRRKPLEQIRNTAGEDELLEPVRLAPTTNQPWFFTVGKDMIHAYCAKSNFVKKFINEKTNKIEMGIGICHLWIAAQHFCKKIEFNKSTDVPDSLPGFHYFTSLKII